MIIIVGMRRVIKMVRWGRGIFEIGFVSSGFLIKYCIEFKRNKFILLKYMNISICI